MAKVSKYIVVPGVLMVILVSLGACGKGEIKSEAYGLYNSAVKNLYDAEMLVFDQEIEIVITMDGEQDNRTTNHKLHFEWNKTDDNAEMIWEYDSADDGGVDENLANYYKNGLLVSVRNGERIVDDSYQLGSLRDQIGMMEFISFSKDAIRSARIEDSGDNRFVAFDLSGGTRISFMGVEWDLSEDPSAGLIYEATMAAQIGPGGELVEVSYELTSSNSHDDSLVTEIRSITNNIDTAAARINFPSGVSFD